ncbi:cytochrome c biogenesis CcdA family protein [Actinomyces culturomici]|uniref:cytochrome c biogenesis CcdA family protein n=1 Tax=Actinomyces culturomici TaxID=1926276 RepID=UPI000E1FB785|nr:cytochrome c biogenesis CcdA family protein [Actinomyces culturomici]
MTLAPLAALLGGALTLLAPCSVMILPAFFAYAFQSRSALIGRTLLFWAGLLVSLVPLGVLAGAAGAVLRDHLGLLTRICALLVIALGVVEILALELPSFRRTRAGVGARAERDRTHPASILLLGIAYGFAGIGCAGPILGAVLVAAGVGGDPASGALLMVLYATGMALPLGLLAALWRGARLAERAWLRPRPATVLGRATTWTNIVSGALLVGLGALLLVSANNPLGGLVPSALLASWEESLMGWAALVPAWALLVALLAIAGAAWYAWPRRIDEGVRPDGGALPDGGAPAS